MDKRNGYSIDDDMMPIVKGDVALPNFEQKELGITVGNIASLGHSLVPKWGYAKMPDGHKVWAQYFLTPGGMGGYLDGGGYILLYANWPDHGRAGTFAICRHEKVEGAGANHSRGWHPGRCGKCGLDMTVDSGD